MSCYLKHLVGKTMFGLISGRLQVNVFLVLAILMSHIETTIIVSVQQT